MVSVSLLKLVAIPNTRPAWPADFADKVAMLDDEPNDRAQYGVIADWLDENGEPELARAFRWTANRNLCEVWNSRTSLPPHWSLKDMPRALALVFPQLADRMTIPGLMADLAAALEELDNSAE